MKLTRKVFSVVDSETLFEQKEFSAKEKVQAVIDPVTKKVKYWIDAAGNHVANTKKGLQNASQAVKDTAAAWTAKAAEEAKKAVGAAGEKIGEAKDAVVNAANKAGEAAAEVPAKTKGFLSKNADRVVKFAEEKGKQIASHDNKVAKKAGKWIAKNPKVAAGIGLGGAVATATAATVGAVKGGKAIKKKVDEKKK